MDIPGKVTGDLEAAKVAQTLQDTQSAIQDLVSLTQHIDLVINLYLEHRFGVPPALIQQQPLEEIVKNLRADVKHYSNLPEEASAWSTAWNVASWILVPVAVVRLAIYASKKANDGIRYLTNNDGTARLDTLEILKWTRETLNEQINEEQTLPSTQQADVLKAQFVDDLKDFFLLIQRILDTAASTTFPVARGEREFTVWGLKNNTSELNILFREMLLKNFDKDVLIEKVESHFEERKKTLPVANESSEPSVVPQQPILEAQPKALLHTLERTQNNVVDVQHKIEHTAQTTEHLNRGLEVTGLDAVDVQERIRQLNQETTALEKKQKPYPNVISQNVAVQRELEAKKQDLIAAQQREATLRAEKIALEEALKKQKADQLALQAQQEALQAQQAALKAQYEQAKQTVVEKVEEPAAVQPNSSEEKNSREVDSDEDSFDVDALSKHLKNHRSDMPHNADPDADGDDDDTYDVDGLCDVLKAAGSNGTDTVAEEEQEDDHDTYDVDGLCNALKASAVQPATKKEFPRKAPAVGKHGYTSAQLHVLKGELGLLNHILQTDREAVNSISSAKPNKLNKLTPLELAFFHNKTTPAKLIIPFKTRKAIIEAILACHPNITDKENSVLTMMIARLGRDKKRCHILPDQHNQLVEILCQYVIAQRTCTATALEDLGTLYKQIQDDYTDLKKTDFKDSVEKLKEAMEVVDLLKQAYLDGKRYTAFKDRFSKERCLDNADVYLVIYDLAQRLEADRLHLKKYDKPTPRMRILSNLSQHAEKARGIATKKVDIKPHQQKNEGVEICMGKSSMAVVQQYETVTDQRKYTRLIDNLTSVIERFGVILETNGIFNRFQTEEQKHQFPNQKVASNTHATEAIYARGPM